MTPSADVSTSAPVETDHRHVWHVFSFEFPFTTGYRCRDCGVERFERPETREASKK